MTTIISHIYNEEFLLPFFIEQHYAKFDHGIILDFGSTDKSKLVIETLAPKWKIIDCSSYMFDAIKVDNLVAELESEIQGTSIALTATEFLIGDPRLISREVIIPTVSLVRLPEEPDISLGQKFHDVYKHGFFPFQGEIKFETEWISRKKGRRIGSARSEYPVGRHFELLGDSLLLVYKVSNCLANEQMIQRRLQMQNKIPESDKAKGFGIQHTNYGKGLTRESLLETIQTEIKYSENLGDYIDFFIEIEKFSLGSDKFSQNFKLLKGISSKFEFNQRLMKENFTENSLVRNLEAELNLKSYQMKEIELELEALKVHQRRPSRNLQDFFHNFLPALKLRAGAIVKKF